MDVGATPPSPKAGLGGTVEYQEYDRVKQHYGEIDGGSARAALLSKHRDNPFASTLALLLLLQ